MDQILGLARVKLVAKNESTSPQDWKVTTEIQSMGKAGADVVIELQGEGAIGGESTRHLSQSGSLNWDVTAKDSATIVVHRLDTKGCSRVLLPMPAQGLSGNWTVWSIAPGTNIKVAGVGGFTKFIYELSQSGNSVTFTSPAIFRSLDIVGTISGNTFTGTFIDHDPKSSKYGQTQGSVEVIFSADGNHFTGRQMMENWGSELQWGGDKVS
jgi:hypothetical protein